MGEMWKCPKCNALVSVTQAACGNCKTQKGAVIQQTSTAGQQTGPVGQPGKDIILSTGDIKRDYKILSIVFAAGIQKFGGKGFFKLDSGYIKDKEYNEMIETVYASAIQIFKEKARAVGADAVVHCNFDIEQIELLEKGLVTAGGSALRIQVFCTGTAVQLL